MNVGICNWQSPFKKNNVENLGFKIINLKDVSSLNFKLPPNLGRHKDGIKNICNLQLSSSKSKKQGDLAA
jgi:hypothetical protein